MLDPGGYGAVTITKGISIINDGVGEAGVLVSGGANGITINAGANDHISLRGLTVKGIGFGSGNGIVFNTGASLTIENCVIRNVTKDNCCGFGIHFRPSIASKLAVSNTVVADSGWIFIETFGTSNTVVTAVLNRVESYNNSFSGIVVSGGAPGFLNVTLTDSVSANNGRSGIAAQEISSGIGITSVVVVRSASVNNNDGIFSVGANAYVRLAQSTVTGNGITWTNFINGISNGNIWTYGDNYMDGNGDGSGGALTVINKK